MAERDSKASRCIVQTSPATEQNESGELAIGRLGTFPWCWVKQAASGQWLAHCPLGALSPHEADVQSSGLTWRWRGA